MHKSSLNILLNISLFVPQKKLSRTTEFKILGHVKLFIENSEKMSKEKICSCACMKIENYSGEEDMN